MGKGVSPTLHTEVTVSCLRDEGQRRQKISVGEKRNGYVCKRNGSVDGASEGATNCKVLCKGKVLYEGERVREFLWAGRTSGKRCARSVSQRWAL